MSVTGDEFLSAGINALDLYCCDLKACSVFAQREEPLEPRTLCITTLFSLSAGKIMATRQRARSPRKTSAPTLSGDSLTGTTDPTQEERVRDSESARASFDTSAYEGVDRPLESADALTARFVGEQVIYKDRHARIAEAAYLTALQRGFAPGYEMDDWLAAEKEIDALLGAADAGQGRSER